MNPNDFQTLAQVVKQHSGLALTPDKAYLLESRLTPIARKWNLASVELLAQKLRAGPSPAQIRDIAEAMTTNESFFFRDQYPFDLFRDVMLPKLTAARATKRQIRIWSAAASSGQEAYSLSMLIKEKGAEFQNWTFDIVGTDLCSEMVEKSRAGVYSHFEVQRGLPAKMLIKYFQKQEDRWKISDDIRKTVRFERRNLLEDNSALGTFDIVFCRNVLIYFDPATKMKVLESIARQMAPDGFLVLGGAETVLGISTHFRPEEGRNGLYRPSVN